jgi:hypothetical protein
MENISLSDPKPDGEDTVVRVEALATAFRAKPEGQAAASADKRGAKAGTP